VPLMGLPAALGAIRALQGGPGRAGWQPVLAQAPGSAALLDEGTAKALLARAGIAVPRGVVGGDLPALARAATTLTAPLALKGLGFAHKTEAGAVRLGLPTLDGQVPMPGAQAYLAEEMVTGTVAEMLVGLRRDPVYGLTLTLGLGGVTAELLADTITLILPVVAADLHQALARLRLWPLLDGYRGRPRADVAALVALVLHLCDLMLNDATLQEIELNPVIVTTNAAIAVDALIRKAP